MYYVIKLYTFEQKLQRMVIIYSYYLYMKYFSYVTATLYPSIVY